MTKETICNGLGIFISITESKIYELKQEIKEYYFGFSLGELHEKIIKAFTSFDFEKGLFQNLIKSHLEYKKALEQKLFVVEFRNNYQKIYNEVEEKVGKEKKKYLLQFLKPPSTPKLFRFINQPTLYSRHVCSYFQLYVSVISSTSFILQELSACRSIKESSITYYL